MNRVLIAGIGNVLLGDDGVGPYVLKLLESQYSFGDNVELADVGTPALDFTHRVVGVEAVILVDCIDSSAYAPGTVLLYSKEDILGAMPAQRLDPHSPALSECLLAAEMLGASPQRVQLIGVVGQSFDPGCELSFPVRRAVEKVIASILSELSRLGFPAQKRIAPLEPAIWWMEPARTSL